MKRRIIPVAIEYKAAVMKKYGMKKKCQKKKKRRNITPLRKGEEEKRRRENNVEEALLQRYVSAENMGGCAPACKWCLCVHLCLHHTHEMSKKNEIVIILIIWIMTNQNK